MQTTLDMPKDQIFKMRIDENDRARLDLISEHYSAPAATAVRILVKEKADSIQAEERRYADKKKTWRERDKDRILWLIKTAGLADKLKVEFDDEHECVWLSEGKRRGGGLQADAEVVIAKWPGSKIEFDDHDPDRVWVTGPSGRRRSVDIP